jgi:iron complex outermembrane receptor protein
MIDNLIFSGGASYDINTTPKAGVHEDAEGESSDAIAALLGAKYYITEDITAFANISRKMRFPTLREAYSAALHKFIVNPDLGPETGILAETGAEFNYGDVSFTVAGFFNFYDDMIIKKTVEDDPQKRFKRVNLSQGRIAGAELYFGWNALERLRLGGHFTYLYSEGKKDGEWSDKLEYKPDYLSMITAKYNFPFDLDLRGEAELTGSQYGENANIGGLSQIDPTVQFNLRAGYNIPFFSGSSAEVFLRVNNIADEYILSKIGLPEPGRTLMGGIILMI